MLPKWRLPNLEFANHLRQLFWKYQIECVVDVGANAGHYGRFLRHEVGYDGLIVSIEPLPRCFARLAETAAGDPDWMVLNCALGATAGQAQLNEMAYDQLSSFLEPKHDQAPHMAPLNQVRGRVPVQVRRLDAVLTDIEACRPLGPIYLKLDTQGFDLKVVAGAGSIIERVCGLQTEVSIVPIYHAMTDWRSAIGALEELGFELSGLWAVNRDPALRAVEFDCVMVRAARCRRDGMPLSGRNDVRD
ncbi:MAG TPA: FkbM family methyltransferase [Stellaceae bacterium]|nr:FkbM family methyltransferase [Stellaceae bacterium]